MRLRWLTVLCVLLVCAPSSALADDTDYPQIEWQGWGIRAGLASNPDQGLVGAQFLYGEWLENLAFTPNVELLFADDYTTLSATVPALYRFPTKTNTTPYVGGGVTLGYINPPGKGSTFKGGLELMGGVEWELKNDNAFFLELNFPFSDSFNDFQFLVGWNF